MFRPDLRLWAGTLRGVDLPRRLAIAAAAGFTSISLAPTEYSAARSTGWSDADLRAAAAGAGVRLAAVDPLVTWLPGRASAAPAAHRAFAGYTAEAVVRIAEAVGAESISVFDPGDGPLDLDRAAEAFASVCDLASGAGLKVTLEFQVYSGIADLRTALETISRAHRPNGCLVIDSWHLFRSGADLPVELPGQTIAAVQLAAAGAIRSHSEGGAPAPMGRARAADASAARLAGLREDSLHHRLLPSAARADHIGLIRALDAVGATPSYGAEVFSDALGALPPERAARLAAKRLRDLLDVARRPVLADLGPNRERR